MFDFLFALFRMSVSSGRAKVGEEGSGRERGVGGKGGSVQGSRQVKANLAWAEASLTFGLSSWIFSFGKNSHTYRARYKQHNLSIKYGVRRL